MTDLIGIYPDLIRRGIFRGVDLNTMAKRFQKLDATRWEGGPPDIRFRAFTRGGAWGTAWSHSRRIVMRIAGGSLERALEVLLHEMVHLSCPAREHHGELFRRRLIACAREAFGLNLDTAELLALPAEDRKCRAYSVDSAIVAAMKAAGVGDRIREDATVTFSPPPPETDDQITHRRAAQREALIASRRAHAEAKLAEWNRRTALAKTRAAKWRAKVRYYERAELKAATRKDLP